MKPDPISLNQADKLKVLSYYYKLSPIQNLDWAVKILWKHQIKQDLGLLTLLEIHPLLLKENTPL